jgi:CBS-domain-containing membrane protein
MTATVGDVMTTSVVALHEAAGYKDIVNVLRRYRVSACPVIDETGRVIGLVSEADLLCKETDPDYPVGLERLNWRVHQETKANALTAEQLMTSPAVAIHPWAPVQEAAREMEQRQIKRLPVVDQEDRLVGIVTRSDVLSVYERPDREILDDVIEVMRGEEFGLNPDNFDVSVSSGIVMIEGRVDRSDTALRLLARIRHSEGVVGIRDDRLTYPRPS